MDAKILMIDDHQMMIEGYKSLLTLIKDDYKIEFTEAYNCKDAYYIITNTENKNKFDVVFLDYSIPSFQEKKMSSGVDLGVLIRQLMPNTKIIMLTVYDQAIKLFEIEKKFQPNGLIIKSDYEPSVLLYAFEKILKGESYYSPLVSERLKEPLFTKGLLDSIDREILTLLAKGLQIRTIAIEMNVSENTIKKRKSKIKDLLVIEKGSDEDILKECRALGLL